MLTSIQNYVQVLSQRYACPPAHLLEVWAATARHDVAAEAARIAQDMEYIWAKEGALLAPLAAVLGKVPLPYGAGIVALYWWARFQALRRPADLPAATQQGIAQFFQQPLPTMFAPPLALHVGALRLWTNASGQLALGGAVLQAGEGYYALYGPRHPQRDLALLPQPSWEAAVSSVMRGLIEVIAQYPLLAPAGAVDWAELTGYEPWAETCAQCGNTLGPRRVCYVCQTEVPPPPLLTPAEYEPRREQLGASIADRLAVWGGALPAAAMRIWRGSLPLPLELPPAPAEIWRDTLALAHQLELSPPDLAVLDWPLAQAAARLYRLGQAAAANLQPQEQEVYRAVVTQNWPQVVAAAARHDDLAELLEQPRRLRPLAEHLRAQVEQGESLPRSLLYLIAARNAAGGTTGTLVQRLAKLPGEEQLPLLKALQWLAPAEPQALQPLTAALQSSCGSTRFGAAYALAGAVALGREPPVAVLYHSYSTDWHPYVHQAVGDALAIGGAPPCPWCGELLLPARWPHRCFQEATSDELADLWQGYLGAVGGRQPHPIAQALGRLWEREAALEWTAAVDMLQSATTTPPERIAALSTVLRTVQARAPVPELAALLRSDTPELADVAAQLLVYTATPLTAPDWTAGWQASMATLAAQGHLELAAACIPPAALDAPTQEGIIWFLQQARRCPACDQWYVGPHDCAPSEEQQQALWHLELRLGSALLQRHPLSRHALLCRYQELAMQAGCPPHPWMPILPPLPPTPLAGGPELLAAATETALLAAWDLVATAPPLAALLAGATTLSRSPAAAVQVAVLEALRQRGWDFCPTCQRFSPANWGHQCLHAVPAAEAALPGDWQPLYPDAAAAIGPWAEVPEGALFAYALGCADWLVATGYSALHVVPAAPDEMGRGALLVQAGATTYAIYGPQNGQIVIDECATLREAYDVALRFLA